MISLEVKKKIKCDVLVVGGGVSGISAAVCAAEGGADVILAEKGGYLGGAATAGLIGVFMTSYDAKGEKQIIKGFYERILNKLIEEGSAISPEKCKTGNSYAGYRLKGHIGVAPYNCEALKRVSEQMCVKSGVRLMYHAFLVSCETEDNLVKKAFFATDSGIYEISARVFIDTSGDAALCSMAGCETVKGDKNGNVQTASTIFTVTGVDKKMLDEYVENHPEMPDRFYMNEIEEGFKKGTFPCGTKKLRIFECPNDIWHVNMAQVDGQFNSLEPFEVANAEVSQRAQIQEIIKFLKATVPALKNISLVETAANIGVREGVRLVGEYVLTKDDIAGGRIFDDAVVVCSNSIDMHGKSGVAYSTVGDGTNYSIPLRCLFAREYDNLMAAGRCVSADRTALAAIRVMPPCFAMGEAAGTAAAISVKEEEAVKKISVEGLRKKLVENGAYII